ncbi:MSMEG_1061 family FMN-dependent PPOX-type flavoprotein [Halobacillus mangrovi]|uniref:MSMEG_1061 family FMN-dependent PPOX-type flavoprotein n=1 Tax=Halobacillus mangrovi TaxID=402384 RepID=UPI003D951882
MKEAYETVSTVEELEQLQGTPGRLAKHKVIRPLDEHCLDFLQHSPFAVISTSNANGECDSSPRGDGPGFAYILDTQHFVLPERMDSIRNLLENENVGLLFMIPGLEETLRINGKAKIIKDSTILQHLEEKGHIPKIGILISVEECYFHCAKALKRSHLWNSDHWPDLRSLAKPAKMMAAHTKLVDFNEAKVQDAFNESYTRRLY